MKALEILKEIKNTENDYDHLKTHKFDEAIKDLESLKLYVKHLEEYKRLARDYLQIQKCSCGTLKVKGYLCSNKDCEKEIIE